MANSRHRSGPWAARDSNGNFLSDHAWSVDNDECSLTESAAIHADGVVVAMVVASEWDSAELLANADLIAAAPELLAALRDLIGWVPGREHWHTDACQKAVERAIAAIAKATGSV